MVIAEVVGDPEDDLSIAAEILRGLRDHGEEPRASGAGDGKSVSTRWNTWALYGLAVPVPSAYRMAKQTLMTGHQRFELRHGSSSVIADRWGLAEIALKGTSLREWYEVREGAALMRYTYRVEETELHGHPAWRLTGRDRVPTALWKVLTGITTLTWPRFFFRGYLWQCPETNRIYAVLGEQPRRSRLVDEVVRRMSCHRQDGE
jgi:hypothetical protein